MVMMNRSHQNFYYNLLSTKIKLNKSIGIKHKNGSFFKIEIDKKKFQSVEDKID